MTDNAGYRLQSATLRMRPRIVRGGRRKREIENTEPDVVDAKKHVRGEGRWPGEPGHEDRLSARSRA